LTRRIVPFTAGDGMRLHLVNVRGPEEPIRAPVMLAHGAGMHSESWLDAPIESTLVDALVGAGYDVWLENWRGSIHAGPNPWTMDQAAVHDHPAAVRAIVEDTGADDIKAVVQCIGSTSFTMSALAGLVPQVSTIVANSVSLHTVVPPAAEHKARYLRPLIKRAFPYLDPSWGERPTTPLERGLSLIVNATHRECDNSVCRMASFIYGAGRPTLWGHANLNGETHDWLSGQFGPAPSQFFDHIARCIRAGHLVSVDGLAELPEDFVDQPPQTDARFALLAGDRNRCFLPVGQRRTFDYLESHGRGRHSLHVIPGYGHLDVFIGRNAHRDTYPLILSALELDVHRPAGRR
jgi:alpha/beta hydrolase fold